MNVPQMKSMLAEQMRELRNGNCDPKRANAVCNTAGKYIGFLRIELETLKMAGIKPTLKMITNGHLPKKQRK